MKESHCLQLRRVGPEHLLNGTVALDRMQKRFVAAQHHFRYPCAPRCGNDLARDTSGRHTTGTKRSFVLSRSSRPLPFARGVTACRTKCWVTHRDTGCVLPNTSNPSPDRLGLSGRGQVGVPLHCATPGPHNPWDCSRARRCPFFSGWKQRSARKTVALVELGSQESCHCA